MENTEVLLTNKKENCISRIKAKWSQRSRAFKIYYILLWALSLICFGICVWSLIFVDTTRQDIYNAIIDHYNKFVGVGGTAHSWTAAQWSDAANNTFNPANWGGTVPTGDDALNYHFYAVIHENYFGDVDKYAWMWSSRADAYRIVDNPISRMSYICYILFIIFAFIWAPITIYCVASMLNVAFPHISKKEKKARKELEEQEQAAIKEEIKKQKAEARLANKNKPQPRKTAPVKKVSADVNVATVKMKKQDIKHSKKSLKGDWLYYHERNKTGKGGKK